MCKLVFCQTALKLERVGLSLVSGLHFVLYFVLHFVLHLVIHLHFVLPICKESVGVRVRRFVPAAVYVELWVSCRNTE